MYKKTRLKIQGFFIAVSILFMFILADTFMQKWNTEFWEEFLDIFGTFLLFLGFIFRIAARGYKSQHSDQGHSLVRTGPYKLTRNPMYFGSFLIVAGVCTMLFNIYVLIGFILIWALFYNFIIGREEAYLSGKFDEEYRRYFKTVPKFFPEFRSIKSFIKFSPIRLSWIKSEWKTFFWVFLICYTGEIFFDVKLFGQHELLEEFLELSVMMSVCAILVGWIFVKDLDKTSQSNI